MRRREFIAALSAAAWPSAAWAQRAALPAVGYLNSGSGEDARLLAAFRQSLKEVGFVERENVSIEQGIVLFNSIIHPVEDISNVPQINVHKVA
jgi:hypothetical protein